jgi:hypothetical protein
MMSERQIARRLGISKVSVHNILHQALAKLAVLVGAAPQPTTAFMGGKRRNRCGRRSRRLVTLRPGPAFDRYSASEAA